MIRIKRIDYHCLINCTTKKHKTIMNINFVMPIKLIKNSNAHSFVPPWYNI